MDAITAYTNNNYTDQIASVMQKTAETKKSFANKSKDIVSLSDVAQKISASYIEESHFEYITSDPINAKDYFEKIGNSFIADNFLSGMSKLGTFITITDNSSIISDDIRDIETQPVKSYSTSLIDKDGNISDISFSDDILIQEHDDGTRWIYFKESNTTKKYISNEIIDEIEGNILSGNNIITINISSQEVSRPDGDNVIFNFADNCNITTGDGNDTIILGNVKNVNISTGNGKDTISGLNIDDSIIDFGDGDNQLRIQKATNSSIRFGEGNNHVAYNSSSFRQNDFNVTPTSILGGIGIILDSSNLEMGEGIQNVSISWAINGSNISVLDSLDGSKLKFNNIINSNVNISGENPDIYIEDVIDSTIKIFGDTSNIFIKSVSNHSNINVSSTFTAIKIGSIDGFSSIFSSGINSQIFYNDKASNSFISSKSPYSVIQQRPDAF